MDIIVEKEIMQNTGDKHPGGMQALGDLLAVVPEHEVRIYNMSKS